MMSHFGTCLWILSVMMLAPLSLAAQQPVTPRESIFGIGDDEFLIGGWNVPRIVAAPLDEPISRIRNIRHVIDWATRLDVSVLRLPLWVGYDPLDNGRFQFLSAFVDTSARLAPGLRYFIQGIGPIDAATFGRDVRFYFAPDSVPYRTWPSRFLYLRGGYTRELLASDELIDRRTFPFEQVYDPRSVRSGTTIADSIVMGLQPEAVNWWPAFHDGRRWVEYPVHTQMRRAVGTTTFWLPSSGPPTDNPVLTLVLRGRLFERGDGAADSMPLFEIDVFYDVGPGEDVVLAGGAVERAGAPRSELCTTFVVRRAQLAPTASRPSLDQVQEARFLYDATRCNAVVNGPLARGAGSRRLNLRVRYVGTERVAVRWLAIRDGRADSVLSFDKPYEPWILRDLATVMRATSSDRSTSLRPTIISFSGGVEQGPQQAAAFDSVNTWVGRALVGPDPFNGGRIDTVTLWTEGAADAELHQTARLPAVIAEFNVGSDARDAWRGTILDVPGRIPSIREHNGGRFSVPEMAVTPEGVEAFETAFQRLALRGHHPSYPAAYPLQLRFQLSTPASVARDHRRRLIVVPFLSSMLSINRDGDGRPAPGIVTMDRLLETNDLWALVGISLAHGATGVFWQILVAETNFVDTFALVDGREVWHGRFDDFGAAGGPFTSDTLIDFLPSFRLSSPDLYDRGYRNAPTRAIIDSFFIGWGQRRRTMREIHAWLRRVGPELMRLRWRDAYTTHAMVPQPFRAPYLAAGTWRDFHDTIPARPLPPSEIVTSVRTRTGPDAPPEPLERSYAEIGFFDVLNATSDASRDTHHVMITNRRVFGRPGDIDPSSTRGRLMESLAETRTIELQLNLPPRRGATRVRVREVAPDTAPLPRTTVARTPVNVVVPLDGAVSVTLGPGRSALLRITYEP